MYLDCGQQQHQYALQQQTQQRQWAAAAAAGLAVMEAPLQAAGSQADRGSIVELHEALDGHLPH